MIVRTFTYETDDDYGTDGFKPDFIRDSNVTGGGFGVCHDVLEHLVDNQQGAEGEMMALGAMMWGRGQAGELNTINFNRMQTLAFEIPNIMRELINGNQTMKSPGRTNQLNADDYDNLDEEFVKAVRKGIADYHDEEDDDTDALAESKRKYAANMVGWLRKGARRAQAIYATKYRLEPSTVSWMFKRLEAEVNRVGKRCEIGDKMKISLNLKQADFKVKIIEPEYEY